MKYNKHNFESHFKNLGTHSDWGISLRVTDCGLSEGYLPITELKDGSNSFSPTSVSPQGPDHVLVKPFVKL